jgi:hypothetical protein
MTKADLKTFLNTLTSETRQIVLVLRDLIHSTVSHVEESLVWGSLSYHRPEVGGRVKGAVCQILVKRGQVRLDFIHGVRLSDPHGLLEGDRVSKRFVPIPSVASAERPEITTLIREAAALDPKRWPNRRPVTARVHELPGSFARLSQRALGRRMAT